ncbi:MAG: hypothetical protein P8Y07_13570 [Gemmatimonadales bacterium]
MITACFALGVSRPASAQPIPRDEYLRFVPLEIPRVIRQTPTSERLYLYGDPADPGYRDVDPYDGMDDRRFAVFKDLSVRFAPFMVQNTWAIPMDFKKFRSDGVAGLLNVDTWNLMTRPESLTSTEEVPFFPIAPVPCTGPVEISVDLSMTDIARLRDADCRVQQLMEEYDPFRHRCESCAEALEREIFENPVNEKLRDKWRGFAKIYSHPFLREVLSPAGPQGYEFILQYWFYYPTNDGGNNHSGDWEHINVVVSPRDRVTRNLTEEEVLALMDGEWSDATGEQELVIKRVDYYFHSKVMQLDFSNPNVYLPRAQWQALVDASDKPRQGIHRLWRYVRWMAYQDDAETHVNTHPVAYIGADNKGTDQIFQPPGGTNRDSHGTFPGPGMFKDVGPGGATEDIHNYFDHKEWFAAGEADRAAMETWNRGGVVVFGREDRVEVIPDWERIYEPSKIDVAVRADWAWMFLPIRFGYPAVESPFAGIVAHAETGNLSVVGPAFNNGWNRSGSTAQYALYDPNLFPRVYQLGWQDGFINDWGYFNLTFPSLIMLPPLDVVWKLLALPIRAATQQNYPTLFPSDKLPFRAMGVQAGVSWDNFSEGYQDLFVQDPQFTEILVDLVVFLRDQGIEEGEGVVRSSEVEIETAFAPYYEIDFFVGAKFASQNRFKFSRSDMDWLVEFADVEEPFLATSDLVFNEWTGFLRFSLLPGSFQPYIKPGYGISWFKLDNMATNIGPLTDPDLDYNVKFTWSLGLGFEYLFRRSRAALPGGLDISIVAEYVRAWNGLGLDIGNLPIESLVILGIPADELPRDRTVGRNQFFLGLNIGI